MTKIISHVDALLLIRLVKIISEKMKEHGRYIGEEWNSSDWEREVDEILSKYDQN